MRLYLLTSILVLIIGLTSQAQGDSIRSFDLIGMNGYNIEQYDKFELILQLDADFDNPYDPDDIRVDATFTSPSGADVIVPAFYYREFDYTLDETGQALGWLEAFTWRVRFTPTELGEWQFNVTAQTATDSVTTETLTFIAVPSERKGFVRVSPDSSDYLAFDDGTFYFPIGMNMAWYTDGRMADYRDWLDALQSAGGNFIRVWLIHYSFGFEWLDTGLGTYGGRQDRMYELDRLVEMLEERDMYMMLTLLTHTAYSLDVDSQWGQNPYNIANGGMLERPADFATNPEAQRLWRMQLRYTVARWGYSPHIMAWEWWNEVNWTELANPDLLVPWIQENGQFLRDLDPYDRLITHSGSTILDAGVWNQPTLDLVQDHIYYVNDWVEELSAVLSAWQLAYDKPFLLGEFGYVDPPEFDPLGIRLHNGLWTAPMSGTLGTGMFWWWDSYIYPDDHYQHFKGISAFFADEDLTQHQWFVTPAISSGNTSLLGLQSLDSALLWIVNRDYNDAYYTQQYEQFGESATFPTIDNAQITMSWIMGGTYTIEWWDTLSGEVIAEDTVNTGGSLIVDVPAFSTSLALKVKPLDS